MMSSGMIPSVPPGGVGGGGDGPSRNPPPYFLHSHQQEEELVFHAMDGGDASSNGMGGCYMQPAAAVVSDSDAHCHALLYNLSVLRDKVQQLQPLVGLAVAHDGPVAAAASGASAVIQEIISTASSMMYAFQHICHTATTAVGRQQQHYSGAAASTSTLGHATENNNNTSQVTSACGDQQQAVALIDDDHIRITDVTTTMHQQHWQHQKVGKTTAASTSTAATTTEEEEEEAAAIIELDAAELLAKYTHYCQLCGKGFKRDANLRMHMRAHGDEYKSSAALANPANKAAANSAGAGGGDVVRRRSYYSCPQEGCRWNRKHAKFQPLKSVICAKNHYKRSHCPKMYVCNRCNLKHFSVLSDLRTHEKHCGDHRWLCSCGTSFSRKDKLIGHLGLFAGHHPAVPLHNNNNGKIPRSSSSTTSSAQHMDGHQAAM